jgi:hypothetical protein
VEAPVCAVRPVLLLHLADLPILLVRTGRGTCSGLLRNRTPHPRTSATPSTRTSERERQVSQVEQQSATTATREVEMKARTRSRARRWAAADGFGLRRGFVPAVVVVMVGTRTHGPLPVTAGWLRSSRSRIISPSTSPPSPRLWRAPVGLWTVTRPATLSTHRVKGLAVAPTGAAIFQRWLNNLRSRDPGRLREPRV